MRAVKADYVKYSLVYDGKHDFSNHFNVKEKEKSFIHVLPSLELIKTLRDYECSFSLKSQGWLKAKSLDETSIKLAQLSNHASFEKTVILSGAKFNVEIMLHKAANKKQIAL